jgi:hypothetical protein
MDIEAALKDIRTSQATIGLSPKVFEKLVDPFDCALKRVTKKNPYRGGRSHILKSSKEKLFFVLYYLKTYPTYDVLGVEYGMNRSNAYRNVQRYLMALKLALQEEGALPISSLAELHEKVEDVELIIVDGTEQRRNRPKNKEKQKQYYSGKKNAIQ